MLKYTWKIKNMRKKFAEKNLFFEHLIVTKYFKKLRNPIL